MRIAKTLFENELFALSDIKLLFKATGQRGTVVMEMWGNTDNMSLEQS